MFTTARAALKDRILDLVADHLESLLLLAVLAAYAAIFSVLYVTDAPRLLTGACAGFFGSLLVPVFRIWRDRPA